MKTKKSKFSIFSDIFLIVNLLILVYITFFLYRADGKPVQAYANEEDYPIYSGRNVYEYWKTTLSEKEQILYEELKESTLQFRKSFSTQVEKLTPEELNETCTAVVLDHPEMFWSDEHGFSSKSLNTEVDTSKTIRLFYRYNEEEAKKIKEQIEPRYIAIIQEAQTLESDWDKIKLVHDRLIELAEYQKYSEAEKGDFQSIVSIFRDQKTVCTGYSNGFKLIMDHLEIDSLVSRDITHEDVSKNHIWNLVKYDGQWYNLDITWDNEISNQKGEKSYRYFMLTHDEFYQTHKKQENIPEN